MEYRACFDFEVEFANGGSLVGKDFRIDVSSEHAADDEIAVALIADLRLLMVERITLSRRRIVEEPHKRGGSAPGNADLHARQIDLSHVIEAGMTTYPGLPGPLICDHLSREASREHYDPGTEFQIGRIDMVANTGTYLDTPYHRFAGGSDLADLPLSAVSNCPGTVVRVAGMEERAIDWTMFAALDVKGKAVLVHTGWDRHWRTEEYRSGHPFLTEKAALFLRDRGAVLVGIDSLNIDDTSGGERPVHTVLLAAGIPIVEHMTNLAALPQDGFRLFAVPPMVRGMGTFPVRAHAIVPPPQADDR